MAEINYLDIILNGFISDKNLLKSYLIRKQKVAEKESFVTKDEFIKRCNNVVELFKKEIDREFYKRKKELLFIADLSKKENEPKEEIEAILNEAKELKREYFNVFLYSHTGGKFNGDLWYNDVMFIKNVIDEIDTEDEALNIIAPKIPINNNSLQKNEIKDKPKAKDYKEYIWFTTGIKLATGEAFDLYKKYKFDKGYFTKICLELGFKESDRPYFSETINDNKRDKNTFADKDKLQKLYKHLSENDLPFGAEFLEKYNKIETE